jgi:hypothetical protein
VTGGATISGDQATGSGHDSKDIKALTGGRMEHVYFKTTIMSICAHIMSGARLRLLCGCVQNSRSPPKNCGRVKLKKEFCENAYYVTQCRLKRMPSSRTLPRVALVRTDVSEELGTSIIGVTIIGELGTRLAVTSNR